MTSNEARHNDAQGYGGVEVISRVSAQASVEIKVLPTSSKTDYYRETRHTIWDNIR